MKKWILLSIISLACLFMSSCGTTVRLEQKDPMLSFDKERANPKPVKPQILGESKKTEGVGMSFTFE